VTLPRLITRDGLKLLLAQLDALVDQPVELLLVGGAAVLVHSPAGVATRDLDAIPTASHAVLVAALARHPTAATTVDLSTASAGFEACLPDDWLDRVQRSEEFSTLRIAVLVPSPEDLAVMKLFRYVAKDAEDIARLAALQAFDPTAFRQRFLHTLATAIGEPRRHAQSFCLLWNELYTHDPVEIDALLQEAGLSPTRGGARAR
jgi:hypothetical protein